MSEPSTQADLREAPHFPCEVRTTCQPPSAWGKDPWPATICDVSTGGLKLRLGRRFERGSGLAIELPSEDGGTHTVLARVCHVAAENGRWLLDCTFISELSDEEVRSILDLDPHHHGLLEDAAAAPRGASVSRVLFQARVAGERACWYVKRLDLSGAWPLPEGKPVCFRLGNFGGPAAHLIVKKCRLVGPYWVVDCSFRDEPAAELLRALTAPA
jgi:hypothetical protein